MNSADRPVVRASVFRLKPIARALSGLAGLMPVMVWAQLPVGADVVAGAATVTTPDVNHMLVQQGSAKAIINWQQFSIGEQGYVQFIQPGASAIALNRVVGADPSAILGKLSANGQVFLVNPNGVFFGAGAQVDVGGLVATTLDIANQDFLDGHFDFRKVAGQEGGATVVNAGVINTAKGGYVVLAGDYAANQGVIQTQAGTALLAAGNALTLQLSGSGLVDFAVDEAAVVELAGVENTGQILANGGRVIMTAKVANDLAATVVNNRGLVQAQSTVEKNGVVYLLGEGGDVANAGTIDASAQAGADAGYVEMRAGGDLLHEAGSRIAVNGADGGASNAGEVYTWADGSNRFKAGAKIEGRGGANGGDGAAVELSGRRVQIAGDVDVRAAQGKGGSILLDPLHITITSQDNTAAGGSSVGELWIEGQLNQGTDVTILADGGAGASITIADLADGVLDGTNGAGTGGSLTLRAAGAGSGIVFENTGNTIRVDRNLTLTADDGLGGYAGTRIVAGHLVAGQGMPSGGGLNNMTAWSATLSLDAGDITAQSLTLGRVITSNTDSAYALTARAHSGDLTVNGNVNAAVTNSTAAAVATAVDLLADHGAVTVTGDVIANATGRGYYHYTWQTAGNNAPTYYGAQPWTLNNQGEHAIDARLNIQAGGNVSIGGAVDVRAIDQHSAFAGNGGFNQTATATQHVFWRATAADAAATIDAGGNVGIGGATRVVADGYANAAYSETESWTAMVNQVNLIAQNQQIYQTYGDHDNNPATPNQWYNPQSVQVTTTGRGSNTGMYTWSQSGMNASGSGPYSSPNLTSWSTGSTGTQNTAMSYENQPGLTATLAISAGGDVTLNGIDNRAVNRSNTGSGSFNDTNWGYQNTAGAALNVSSSLERRYGDSFSTSFTAAPATAATTISAGDNRSVTLNGGGASYTVEAQHTALTTGGNSIAHASMTVTAGSAGGASGDGLITVGGPVTVRGASSNEVHLTVTNHDGVISHADGAGTLAVNNQYSAGVARAAFTSGMAGIDLGTVTVNAGHTGHFTATAEDDIDITSASVTAGNTGNFTATAGGNIDLDGIAVTGTSNNGNITLDTDGSLDLDTATIIAGQIGNFTATSGAAMTLGGVGIVAGNTGNFTATAGGDVDIAAIAVTGTSNNGNITLDTDGSLDLGTSNITAGQMGTFDATSGDAMTLGGMAITAGHTARLLVDSGDTLLVTGALSASGNRRGEVDIDAAGNITVNGGGSVTATSSSGYEGYPSTLWLGTSVLDIDGLADVLLNGNVASNAHGAASNTVSSGGLLTIGAGTTTQAGSSQNNATLGLTGGSGVLANGNVTTSANAGLASTTVNTAGGSTAGITQGSAGTIGATGLIATTTVRAGSASSLSATSAAQLNLAGTVRAQAGVGAAQLTVDGAGGTINNFSATSTANTATAVFTGYGSAATLTLTGTGTVTGNSDGGSGAQLSVTSAGAIAATGSSAIQVRNNNGGALAGAAASFAGAAGVGLGGVQASTAGGGAVNISGAAGNGDVTASGTLSATALGGNASVAFATTGEMSVNAVSASSTDGSATVALNGLNGVTADGDITARSTNGNAALTLTSADGDVGTANGTQVSVTGGNQATLQITGDGIALLGDGSVVAGSGAASATLTASGNLVLDGDWTASSIGSSASAALDSGALLTLGSAASLNVLGNLGATTGTLSAVTGMTLAGDVLVRGANGAASLDIATDGGSGAGIGQGSDSRIAVEGISATLNIAAGGGVGTTNTGNAAALDLQGSLQAQAGIGAASLAAAGAGGTINDFSVTSTGNTAQAALTALVTDELLALTGIGSVTGNHNSTTGASLNVESAGALDARLASLTITNTNGGAAAGAGASFSAAGLLRLGDVAAGTSGNETVSIHATGNAVEVDGALSTTALAGGSTIDLIALGGGIATTADASLAANAHNGTAAIVLNAVTGISNDGAISADSSGGSASVLLRTTGGNSAAVSQGAGGSIDASGALAAVTLQAGGSLPAAGAALDLGGEIRVDASAGDARLTIEGGSGNVGAFAVTAAAGRASAELTAHNGAGQVRLLGESLVQGNSDRADGAALTVTVAGRMNAGGADITVGNLNTGAAAGATASFDVNNGTAQLGGVTVRSQGGGLAGIDAQASGNLGATAVSASGRTASVTLTGGGNVNLGDVGATGADAASIDVTSTIGNITQLAGSDLSATASAGLAAIDLDAAGSAALGNASASGVQGSLTAIARNGTLGQAAGSTLLASGTSQSAALNLTSSGAMTLDGSVLASSTDASATTTLDAAGIAQGATGAIGASGRGASTLLDAAGAVNLGGALTANGGSAGATITVEGGSIQLGGLDAEGRDATVTLTSAGGIALNGNASIDGGESADFTATAQNGTLSQAAGTTLRAGAGTGDATATLTSSGAMTLNGSVQTASTQGHARTGLQAAGISQGADGAIGASGTTAATALEATGALDLGGLLRANATAGNASVTAQGAGIRAHGIDVDATLRASATLASTGAVSLTGSAAIDGGESADFTAAAQHGILTQAAGASLRAAAHTATVALTSAGAMTVDGSVASVATGGGATTELTAASISQGANGAIGASGVTAAATLETTGALALDGLLSATASAGNAGLTVNGAAGRVHDIGVSASGTAAAHITTAGDLLLTGDAVAVNGGDAALLQAGALNGSVTQQAGSHLTAGSAGGTARIELSAAGALALRDATVNGAQAELVGAAGGALSVAAGATQQAKASGTGSGLVQLTSGGAMTIDGNLLAAGPARADVLLTSGAAGFTQGANSAIGSIGDAAGVRIAAGGLSNGPLALSGLLQLQGGRSASLQVSGGAGHVHDFDVAATGGQASASIDSAGSLALTGNGRVSGNADADGATLMVNAGGALDTRGATLNVANSHAGELAGASARLTSGGELHSGPIAVAAAGGADAALALLAGGALRVNADLSATAHNAGAGHGGARVHLASGRQGNAGDIRQQAGTRIDALSGGNAAADAAVLIEAGHCCDGKVELLGATTAQVSGGEGDATIRVHGSDVAVQDLTAKVAANGAGDTLIALAAPYTLTVNGMLDSQAANAAATAGITLVTDKLDYRADKATLSRGNGRVQLAPFNTSYLIGVESEPDFDATPAVNYNMALLRRFDGNNAELVFGGAYDRTPWLDANGNACVPGMAQWADMGQHTGEIHVAGSGVGQLRLAASRMVFDTTGSTYYHDNQMPPWSVPAGRTAIYVPPPTVSLDRYLDRTDNSIQTSLFGVQNATAPTLQVRPLPAAPEGTVPIAGDMFMAGDGVNLSRVDVGGTLPGAGGAGVEAGGSGSTGNGSGASSAATGDSGNGGGAGSGKANAGSGGQGAADQSAPDSRRPDSARPDEDDDEEDATEV